MEIFFLILGIIGLIFSLSMLFYKANKEKKENPRHKKKRKKNKMKKNMKIFEINLYDSLERHYVQAKTEKEAVKFFIKNCLLNKEDKIRYEQEYKEGNTENFYIEEIEIWN